MTKSLSRPNIGNRQEGQSGLLYCADGGSKLTHRYNFVAAKEARSKVFAKVQYEKRKQDRREFTVKNVGRGGCYASKSW